MVSAGGIELALYVVAVASVKAAPIGDLRSIVPSSPYAGP
jgi:hypothetical protein